MKHEVLTRIRHREFVLPVFMQQIYKLRAKEPIFTESVSEIRLVEQIAVHFQW